MTAARPPSQRSGSRWSARSEARTYDLDARSERRPHSRGRKRGHTHTCQTPNPATNPDHGCKPHRNNITEARVPTSGENPLHLSAAHRSEDLGHRFGHAVETLTARPATPHEADLLEVPGEWVVQVLRVSYSTEGIPIHSLETICAASRHTFPIGRAVDSDQF
ncbi:UTRA domain-containing protein [Nocardiopsis terrae]